MSFLRKLLHYEFYKSAKQDTGVRKPKTEHMTKATEVLKWFFQYNCVAGLKFNQSTLEVEERGFGQITCCIPTEKFQAELLA